MNIRLGIWRGILMLILEERVIIYFVMDGGISNGGSVMPDALSNIRDMVGKDIDGALSALTSLDLTPYPKRLTADIYLLLAEAYLHRGRYMQAALCRQRAVDIDPSIEHIVCDKKNIERIDKIIDIGIGI
jgi:tetratricopeptide (TPR) repeat protein